jgi:hypothetical protein
VAHKDAICFDSGRGPKAGYMGRSPGGVLTWYPTGTMVAVPDGPGRHRLATDIDIDVSPSMASVLKGYGRLR